MALILKSNLKNGGVHIYLYIYMQTHIHTHSIRDFNKMEEQQLEQKSKFTQTPSYLPSEFTNIF